MTHYKLDNHSLFSFRTMLSVWIGFFAVTSLVLVLVMPRSPAHSMVIETHKNLPAVEPADHSGSCRALLNDTRAPSSSSSSNDQKVGVSNNRAYSSTARKAGKTAALAYMLGHQLALDPSQVMNAAYIAHKQDASHSAKKNAENNTGSRSALSIVAYRQCMKNIALKASRSK